MSSLPRAIAASAALHAAIFGLVVALAPRDQPKPAPRQVEVRMVELVALDAPAPGGGEEAGGVPAPPVPEAKPASTVRSAARTAPVREEPRVAAAPREAPQPPPVTAVAPVVSDAAPAALPEDAVALAEVAPQANERSDAGTGAADGSGTATAAGEPHGIGAGGPGGIGTSGSGSGAGSGNGNGPGAGHGSGEASLLDALRWQTARCYPRTAQRRRTEGTVEVRFCVDGSGHPTEVEVVRSSGSGLLDDAATDCVIRRSAPFVARDLCITAPIRFRLR